MGTGGKLDFEHKAIIAIIFLSLFGFFFLILGIVFTALGYTGNYLLFRSMGPALGGIALVMIVVTAYLGYKVQTIRVKKTAERQRQMAILQRASSMRQRQARYEAEQAGYDPNSMVPGHYAYAGDDPNEYYAQGMTNTGYYTDSHPDARTTSASSYPPQPHMSSSTQPSTQQYYSAGPQTPTSKTIPTQHQPAPSPAGYSAYPPGVTATPKGYSAYPEGAVVSPDSHNSSHSSLVGVPDMGMGMGAMRASPVATQQVILTTPALESARPRRPAPARPTAVGRALPQ